MQCDVILSDNYPLFLSYLCFAMRDQNQYTMRRQAGSRESLYFELASRLVTRDGIYDASMESYL